MVRKGLACLRKREKEVNKLNVFPVADGDTGTNMCATLENGIQYAKSGEYLAHYLKALSEGMLFGARGNSGVILSQFFKGLQLELSDCSDAGSKELRNALICGYRNAYASVVKPVEGTILTVFREGIEYIRMQMDGETAIEDLLLMYMEGMKKALACTPELLPVLKESGVIDSGGQGFIYIVEGMLDALSGDLVGADKAVSNTPSVFEKSVDFSLFNEYSRFDDGYCMEFILQLLKSDSYMQSFDLDCYIGDIGVCGDSLVVVCDDTRVKVHVHTRFPEKVMALSRRYGEFLSFKLENMQLQHNERIQSESGRKSPHKTLAMIAVVNGGGLKKLFEELGCDEVICCSDTMNASAQEFIDAFNRLNADTIVVLPNNKNVILAAQQAAQLHGGGHIHVLPSRSIAEGYFAIAMDVPENDTVFRIRSMESGLRGVTTLIETTASRDFACRGLTCRRGEEIVLRNDNLISVGRNRLDAMAEALRWTPGIDDAETCVIFSGADVSEEEINALTEYLEDAFPWLEAEIMEGGQKIYRYIIGLS